MIEQTASISSLLCTILVSDALVLRQAWQQPFTTAQSWSEWRHVVYVAYHRWAARYPDHVFDSAWLTLTTRTKNRNSGLNDALFALVDEYLECRQGKIYVQRARFGAWQQSILSRVTSLPLQAAARVRFAHQLDLEEHDIQAPWAQQCLTMLRPYAPAVDEYVVKEGLHETHLHLNGTTHAEVCWLRALYAPQAETADFVKAWTGGMHSHRVRDLIALIDPELSPTDFKQRLVVARTLRSWLIASVTGAIAPGASLPKSCISICETQDDALAPAPIDPTLELSVATTVGDEIRWQSMLIAHLTQSPSVQLERMFHIYLLLQNLYYRLLVQSEVHYGFDQFQKFTLTDLRVPAENDYLHRFQSIHGQKLITSRVKYLEGRFAPKTTFQETHDLLHKILEGYRKYLVVASGNTPKSPPFSASLDWVLSELELLAVALPASNRSAHRLTLVAHFIKLQWFPRPSTPYRHHALDVKLRDCTNALLLTMRRLPKLKMWLRGIDAAGNELHAPPECFASVFRVCRNAGLAKSTFHAGEDFPHLLSGVRYMLDTIELLDLQNGDRLGHGTAMGISPELWIDRMPQRIALPRGEWMLSVLAGLRLLRSNPDCSIAVERLNDELAQLTREVFGRDIEISEFEQAMALRDLSIYEISRLMGEDDASGHSATMSDVWLAEAERVATASKHNRPALELLWLWQSDQTVWQRSEELVQKDAAFLDAPTLVALQQALMARVVHRGVVIETLPTSNVRISQYVGFHEHHALRWMNVPSRAIKGDSKITVSLGSDDPGIFANDLESEFHHLYATMTCMDISEADALDRLSMINQNGQAYRFHDPQLN